MKKLFTLAASFALSLFSPCTPTPQAQAQSNTAVLRDSSGITYEVVTSPPSREVHVYASGPVDEVPIAPVLTIRRSDQVLERVPLVLDSLTPERSHYTGLIPSSIYVAGGLTFALESK